MGTAGASTSQAKTPKYDDNATVVFAGTGAGQDLDPYKAGGTLIGIVDIYDGLIRATPDFKLVPSLATAWKYSADNLTLTFTLRQGVKFSDGTPFDSSAVVASLNRARSGATSQQKVVLGSIANVTAPDPNTAVITLSQPDATLVNNLSTLTGFIINPKMINDDAAIRAGKLGVGTGAYTMRQFLVGTKLVMDRNDSYWDKQAIQHAPKVYEFDLVTDGSARLNGLKTGAYTAVQALGTPGLRGPGSLPDNDKSFVNATVPSFATFGLAFRMDKPPFDNEKVRLAVAHALDLTTADEGVLGDEMNCYSPPATQLNLKSQIGYDATLKPLKFDLRQAKQLLAEAGYPDGKGFPSLTITGTVSSADAYAGQVFQGMLARIGITNVTLDPQPSRVFALADFQTGKANMLTGNMAVISSVDPSTGIDIGVLGQNLIDDSPVAKQMKTLAAQGKSELDLAKRDAIYKQISKLVNEHALYIPFCRAATGYATVKKLSGLENSLQLKNGISEAQFIRVAKTS